MEADNGNPKQKLPCMLLVSMLGHIWVLDFDLVLAIGTPH